MKFYKNGNDECFKKFNSSGVTMLPNKNNSKKSLKDRIRKFEVKEKE